MPKRIGVIGTFIRDTIVTLDGCEVESIGGLYHALAYLANLVDAETSVLPLCHVGEDFYATVQNALSQFGAPILFDRVHEVPQPNTQVKLIYRTTETRDEITSAPMPPITATEITALTDCNAVLVNLITGVDVILEALLALRHESPPPLIYLDLHSLALGIDSTGKRYYREIPHWQDWMAACDILQMNEREAATLAGLREPFSRHDLVEFGKQLVGEPRFAEACHITLGSEGSLLFHRNGKRIYHEHCQPLPIAHVRDIIGCGDAFGAAFVAHFLRKNDFLAATHFANKIAGLNCTFMGSLTPEAYRLFVQPYIEDRA
jgi:sugar/nucleoside kinase (ribokinase family)